MSGAAEFHQVSEYARHIAAQRRRVACAVCGKAIEGVAIRRYCSSSCRVAAYRRRRQAGTADGERYEGAIECELDALFDESHPLEVTVVELLDESRDEEPEPRAAR